MVVKRFRRNNIRRGKKTFFNINQTLDSAGPQGKMKGSAAQLAERYRSLAHDAQISGNHVLKEDLLQHADHYTRLVNAYGGNFSRNNFSNTPGTEKDDLGEEQGAEELLEESLGDAPQPEIFDDSPTDLRLIPIQSEDSPKVRRISRRGPSFKGNTSEEN